MARIAERSRRTIRTRPSTDECAVLQKHRARPGVLTIGNAVAEVIEDESGFETGMMTARPGRNDLAEGTADHGRRPARARTVPAIGKC